MDHPECHHDGSITNSQNVNVIDIEPRYTNTSAAKPQYASSKIQSARFVLSANLEGLHVATFNLGSSNIGTGDFDLIRQTLSALNSIDTKVC
jgi:hypothetical protein